jgi:hypothetical protein
MRYEVTTSLTPEEVIEDALHYFGPGIDFHKLNCKVGNALGQRTSTFQREIRAII